MANPRREAQRERSNAARQGRMREARRRRTMKAVAIMLIIALAFTGYGVFATLTGGGTGDENAGETTTTAPPTPCPPVDGSAERRIDFAAPPPMCIDPAKNYTATFDTTEGTVAVDLDTERTPATTNNFVVLSRYGYYDGTEIFRTAPGIAIIQGGSPHTQDNSDPGPGYTIPDEGSGFTYREGDLVMARTSAPDSAGGQYFFATGPEVSQLDAQGAYVKFGTTTEGLDALKSIIALHQGDPGDGAPSRTVTVNDVTITES